MLDLLNQWGGLISLIGLFFSVWVYFITGNIKKDIRKNLEIKTYKESKAETIKKLRSLIESLDLDRLEDFAFQHELLYEINNLAQHKGFVNKKNKLRIMKINSYLKKEGITKENAQRIIWLLSIILGELNIDPIEANEKLGA